MVRALAGDSTITNRVPCVLAAPLLAAAAPLSPLSEAAVFPAALLLAGTLLPTSHPRHGPSRLGRLPATHRRDAHRMYHTRRGHEMPVPAVIPATRFTARTVPDVASATG